MSPDAPKIKQFISSMLEDDFAQSLHPIKDVVEDKLARRCQAALTKVQENAGSKKK